MIAIRGATTCSENTKESIVSATAELLQVILKENSIKPEELVSIIFTCTPDITAAFPAQAARSIGLSDVPLLGAQEIMVEGAPKLCIRVMLHINRQQPRTKVKHIYLNGAQVLRPDLVKRVNIAIDGPAGAGKSTVAKELAKRLGLRYLDTGAMYRALTYEALEQGIDVNSASHLAHVAKKLDFGLDESSQITLAGRALGEEIRSPEVTKLVSLVSSHAQVRDVIVEQQQRIAACGGIVMDGRDIGTTVMVDAPVKIFLTANLEERARRRQSDLMVLGHETSLQEVIDQLRRRDYLDSTRAASPLKPAEDAIILDSTHLSINEVVEKIIEIVQRQTEGTQC